MRDPPKQGGRGNAAWKEHTVRDPDRDKIKAILTRDEQQPFLKEKFESS